MTGIIEASITVDRLLERVEWIAPIIREHASAAEHNRMLFRPVVDAMREADLYKMARPQAFGGLELDPVSTFRVVEEVSRHDSAAGWNLNLSVAAEYFLAWLPDDGAQEILDTPDLVLAATFNPPGQAVPVEGGYQVSGRWRFASGCHTAKWVLVIAAVTDDRDTSHVDPQGNPKQLWVWLPASQISILDTWHTIGMRGTGSHDVQAEGVFVPAHHTAPMAPLEHWGSAFRGPLYRLTVWPPIALLVPPALGIARAAIDDFLELAGTKTPSFTGSGLRERHVVQRQLAEAEAHLGAARAYFYGTFEDAWRTAVDGAPIDVHRKLSMQLASTHAVVGSAKTVDLVYAAAGSSSVRNECPLQRHFRDVHTITQHAFVSAQRYESVGALMLGTESDWGFFAL